MTFKERFNDISSESLGARAEGYRALSDLILVGGLQPTPADVAEMIRQLRREAVHSNAGGWCALSELIHAVQWRMLAGDHSGSSPTPAITSTPTANGATVSPDSLGPWLMHPFQRHSFVYYVLDPDGWMRDERTVAEFAFDMPEVYRKGMERRPILMGEFKPTLEELGKVSAVMFVGRFGLFGQHVAKQWGMENSRFRFISEIRPPGLKVGMLDTESYHRLLTDSGPKGQTRDYKTEQNGDERIDYGLIRRYSKFVSEHSYTVLHVAGISAPGSCAGARWVSGLFSEHEAIGPIHIPEKITPTSDLEAIVRVVAHRPANKGGWSIQGTELVELYVDDQQWYKNGRFWGPISPKIITVVWQGEPSSSYTHESVKEIWLDDQLARFHGSRAARNQFLSVCRVASENKGLVSIDELKADGNWWGTGTQTATDMIIHIKRTISDLKKRRFGQALVDRGEDWMLSAEVRYEFRATCSKSKARSKRRRS